MLITADLAQVLARVTYKPGWRFAVYDGRFEGQHLVITTQVLDAYDPDSTVTLDVHSMLPPMRDEQQFLDWLLWRVCRIETHEAREFLRVNGVSHNDPHAEYADRDLHDQSHGGSHA